MGQVINIRDTQCPQCPELQPVTDIEADMAFILVAAEVFEFAIKNKNYELAMQVADQVIVSGNRIGQYSIHQTHL